MGARASMMASVAPHVDGLVAARPDFLQVIGDLSKHPIHFAGTVLVWILVGSKIVGAERFAFFSFVAIRAAGAERPGKSNHYGSQASAGPILGKDLKVFGFFRPSPF